MYSRKKCTQSTGVLNDTGVLKKKCTQRTGVLKNRCTQDKIIYPIHNPKNFLKTSQGKNKVKNVVWKELLLDKNENQVIK